MKRLTILTAFIIGVFLFAPIFAEGKTAKSSKDEKAKKYETLSDALQSGQPIMCLFVTAHGCHCTMAKVKSATALCDTLSLPKNMLFNKTNIDSHREYAKKYRLLALPTIIFFDKKGNEVSRLQSWQINHKNIESKLAELNRPSKDKK